jgi:hypothetical protein
MISLTIPDGGHGTDLEIRPQRQNAVAVVLKENQKLH